MEVFGRGLPVGAQALIMLLAFTVIGVTNMTFRPLRTLNMGLLEYLSISMLAATLMLGLFFVNVPDMAASTQVTALTHMRERTAGTHPRMQWGSAAHS